MLLYARGGVRGGLLRFPLPGPSAEGTPGSAAQKTRPGPSAIVRDAMTFEDVVREHEDAVYGAALRILGDRDAALDAASQTFMKAYRSIASYDPSRPIRHWLLRIAVNEAITIGRARTRERARQVPEGAAAEIADRAPTPEREAVDREARDSIRAAGGRTGHEQVLRGLRGLALVGIGAVAEGTVALAAFNILSALDLTWPLDIALGIVMAVARQLVVIGGVTASPAVGLATLAAVIFATIYERNGRESLRVRAS